MSIIKGIVAGALATGLAVSAASASTITYTITAEASGTFGGIGFVNDLVTITGSADSSLVPSSGAFQSYTLPTTISVAGVGAGVLSGGTVFVAQTFSPPAAGFSTSSDSVLDAFSSSFASWSLNQAIGPITGRSFIRSDLTFTTTFGGFNLQSAGDATFTATLSAVPEPSTWALMLLGFGGLAFGAYARRSGAAVGAA